VRSILLFLVLFFVVFNIWANLKIGIIGDQTGSKDMDFSYSVLKEGCSAISKYNPDLVLHVGDIVESSKNDNDIKEDFNKVAELLSSINSNSKPVSWYSAAGDHDVNPPDDYIPGTTDYSKKNLFLQLLQREFLNRNPSTDINKLYYSFDYKNYHFICLFSEDNLRTDPRWGNIFMDKIKKKQFDWLKSDLKRTSGAKGIIVFMHQPMWYNWSGWKKVHDLLRQYPVIAVITGHFHYNQDEGLTDGIRYIVVGSTGGDIKNASEGAGGLYHVTLMQVTNDNKITLKLIPLNSNSKNLTFTKRKNMDRIQAISTALNSIAWDPDLTEKVVKVNPIDIPVNIYFNNSDNQGNWILAYQSVNPGEGIMISNLSSVTINKNNLVIGHGANGIKYEFVNGSRVFWIAENFNNL
jgi:hypothetical protein